MLVRAGMLLGIEVRTGSPLNLNLADPVWKQLAGLSLSVTDLNEIDKDYVPGAYFVFVSFYVPSRYFVSLGVPDTYFV